MKIQYISQPFILLIFTLTLIHCKNETSGVQEDSIDEQSDGRIFISQSQWQSANYSLVQPEERSFHTSIQSQGHIVVPPQYQSVVHAPQSGFLSQFALQEGDFVRKGAVLFYVKNTEFLEIQRLYAEKSKELDYLKGEYERYQQMHEEKVTATKNLTKAKSAYETAAAVVEGLGNELRLLHISPEKVKSGQLKAQIPIYAPIDGFVTDIQVMPGQGVTPEMELLHLMNTKKLQLEMPIYENDISALRKGQEVLFSIGKETDPKYKAHISHIGNHIGENRTIKVVARIDIPKDVPLVSGMYAPCLIHTDSYQAMALPETAMVAHQKEATLLRLDGQNEEGYYFLPERVSISTTEENYVALPDLSEIAGQYLKDGVFDWVGE